MQEKDFFDSDDIFPVMLHSIYAERINFRSCARHETVLEKYGKHRKETDKGTGVQRHYPRQEWIDGKYQASRCGRIQ